MYFEWLCCSMPLPVRHRDALPSKKSAMPSPLVLPLKLNRYSVFAADAESTRQPAPETPKPIWWSPLTRLTSSLIPKMFSQVGPVEAPTTNPPPPFTVKAATSGVGKTELIPRCPLPHLQSLKSAPVLPPVKRL